MGVPVDFIGVPVYDFELYQGREWRRRLTFDGDAGFVLTDRVVRMQLRLHAPDRAVVAEPTVIPDSATTCFLVLTAEQTAAIGRPGETVTLHHDLFVDDLPFWWGTAICKGRVTR